MTGWISTLGSVTRLLKMVLTDSTVCSFLINPPQVMRSLCISHTASGLMSRVVLKDIPRQMVLIKTPWKIMKKQEPVKMQVTKPTQKKVKETRMCCYQ